jgi:hypothetical protein
VTGPDIYKILNSLQIILLNRQSGKHAINEHLLILGVDGGSIDKAGVENIEAIGDVFVDNEGDLIVQVFGSGYEGVD